MKFQGIIVVGLDGCMGRHRKYIRALIFVFSPISLGYTLVIIGRKFADVL